MPQAIAGLTGFVIGDPEATAEQRHGGTADPKHAQIGEKANPYPWEVFPGESPGPYGLENGLLGMDICSYEMPAGFVVQDPTMDQTPVRGHAAPWPKGLPNTTDPDQMAERLQESAGIHSSNLGGSREALYLPTADAQQDQWQLIDETDPGIMFPQMEPVPSQVKTGGVSGYGSRDRVNSGARQNGFGFDAAHIRRRFARGSIPGNYMWMQPGSRPLVKSLAGPAIIPVGVNSPFYGQDPGQAYDAQGGVLMVLPASYTAPPDPSVAPSYADASTSVVELW